MISALQKQPNGTIQLTITIPFDAVKKPGMRQLINTTKDLNWKN